MDMQTLSRSHKAMQIERRTSRLWTVGMVGINVPSQTTAGVTYHTTLNGCDCADSRYRVGTPGGPAACKHVLAARIFAGRNRS